MEKWKEDTWNGIIEKHKSIPEKNVGKDGMGSFSKAIDVLMDIQWMMQEYLHEKGLKFYPLYRDKTDPILFRFMNDFLEICLKNNIPETDKIYTELLQILKDKWLEYYEDPEEF